MTPETEQLRMALDTVNATKSKLGHSIKDAVEAICKEYEGSGILPHVAVETRPHEMYGGTPRGIRAFVTVDFTVPSRCRPETFTPHKNEPAVRCRQS